LPSHTTPAWRKCRLDGWNPKKMGEELGSGHFRANLLLNNVLNL
jgi:hypothetical protein